METPTNPVRFTNASLVSVNVPTWQPTSGQAQRRLRQAIRVGRPKHGTSISLTVRRPLETATTPHAGQPVGPGGDSTVTVSPPPAPTCTPVRWRPSSPTRRSQSAQYDDDDEQEHGHVSAHPVGSDTVEVFR